MSHIFISYQSDDRVYVNSLKDALRANGYEVWLDASNLPGSPNWEDEIKSAIDNAFVVLIVLTTSAEESKWVKREKHYADNLDKPIIPLLREGQMWFSLLDMQFIDARKATLEDPAPMALYAALFRYIPIDTSFDTTLQTIQSSNRDQAIAAIRRLAEQASNTLSPQGYVARQLLKQLSSYTDVRVAKRAQMEIEDLPQLPVEEFRKANIKTEPLKPLPELPTVPAATTSPPKSATPVATWILGTLLVVALIVIAWLLIKTNQSNSPLSGTEVEVQLGPTRTSIVTSVSARSTTEPSSTPDVLPTGTPTQPDATSTITPSPSATATIPPTSTSIPTQTHTATAPPTATPVPTLAPTLVPGMTRTDLNGIVQVWVPAGCFMMGQDQRQDRLGETDERPYHEVCINKGFWLDQTEVTNESYRKFTDAGGYSQRDLWSDDGWAWLEQQVKDGGLPKPFNDSATGFPRTNVTWYEAQAYAKWRGGRLPTEAEWEWAARGSESRIFPWGNTFDGTLLNFCDQSCPLENKNDNFDDAVVYTAKVGAYEGGKSWINAYNMAGNVWEWTNDWYGIDYYKFSPVDDPQGPLVGTDNQKVAKGGSWGSSRASVRSSYRATRKPTNQDQYYGIRIASSE